MVSVISRLRRPPRVNVVRLSGAIAGPGRVGSGLSDQTLAGLIDRAFRRGRPCAVALVISSPGGSPVQSSLIASRIRRTADETGVPVHAFVEDVAASGGYWLAMAADRIWVDSCSVVGSIGVIAASFGAHELIKRHGVERRVHTAGRSKSMLDPFRPEAPEDVARLQAMLDQIHAQFIAEVRRRRGDRLDMTQDLFTGDIWIGERAVAHGLADGIGHLEPVMKAEFGPRTRFRTFSQRRGLRALISAGLLAELAWATEESALYARFGL